MLYSRLGCRRKLIVVPHMQANICFSVPRSFLSSFFFHSYFFGWSNIEWDGFGTEGFFHLPFYFLSGQNGFKMSYFLFYFWLSLTASFGEDRGESGFLTNFWAEWIEGRKGSSAFSSIYLADTDEFKTNYIFLYFLFSLTVPLDLFAWPIHTSYTYIYAMLCY